MEQQQHDTGSVRAAALAYAQRGWRVFPCHTIVRGKCTCLAGASCSSPGKHPRTPNGCLDATTDAAILHHWWERWPNANVGLATGKESDLVVLDIDEDKEGNASLTILENRYGRLPPTVESLTGGGGWHALFRYPSGLTIRNSAGRLGPGIDVRGDGGYVIAPPSLHISGRRYTWELTHHPDDVELAPFPAWAVTTDVSLSQNGVSPHDSKSPFVLPETIPQGKRNDTLFRLGCSLRAKGLSAEQIRLVVEAENLTKCTPPVEKEELASILRQVARYQAGTQQSAEEMPDVEAFVFNPKAGPDIELFEGLKEIDDKFKRTWEHRRKDFKNDAIEVYEYSLARQARQAEWTTQEIVNLLIYHRRKYNVPPQTAAYYRTVLWKTRQGSGKTDEEALHDAETQEALEGGEAAVRALIRERLGLPFMHVLKRGKQKALYSFLLDDGEEIAIGPIESLAQPRTVRLKILEVTKTLIRSFKEEEWRKMVNLFGPLTVDIEVGGSRKEMTYAWVSQYLDNADRFEFPQALLNSEPVIEHEEVYVNGMSFRRYLFRRWRESLSERELASLLSECGFTQKSITGRIMGKAYCRSYWHIHQSVLDRENGHTP